MKKMILGFTISFLSLTSYTSQPLVYFVCEEDDLVKIAECSDMVIRKGYSPIGTLTKNYDPNTEMNWYLQSFKWNGRIDRL